MSKTKKEKIKLYESEKKNAIVIIREENLADKIYLIRGQRVMLDFELAEIYGYETKRFNEQVKNNIEKFDEDFRFRLTKDEYENLRSKISTSSSGWGGKRYMPFAFTESGIYMLMTVLKGELATKQSKALIRIFKAMKDYIIENQSLIGADNLFKLSTQTNQNTIAIMQNSKDIAEIKEEIKNKLATKDDFRKVMENFIDPNTYKHFLIMNGRKIESRVAYSNIYKSARQTIYIVDNYINLKTLELIRAAKKDVKIVIFSDNIKTKDMLTKPMLKDFRSDYPNILLSLKITNGKYHDRYIAIDYNSKDEKIYHCGSSSKDSGTRITTISRIDDTSVYHRVFDELLTNKNLELK